MKKTLVQKALEEKINYGGELIKVGDLYLRLKKEGFSEKNINWILFLYANKTKKKNELQKG